MDTRVKFGWALNLRAEAIGVLWLFRLRNGDEMAVRLSKRFVESIEPTVGRQTFGCSTRTGLRLIVHPTGKKVWSWQGRCRGHPTTLTLGSYPAFSVDEAQRWAVDLARQRHRGEEVHPGRRQEMYAAEQSLKAREADKVREAEERASARNCNWLFDLYMVHDAGALATARERQQTYNREIRPIIGLKVVDAVTHDDLMAIVRAKARSHPAASRNLVTLIKRWFRWSVTEGRDLTGLREDPSRYIKKLSPARSRDRVLCDYEIGVLLRALDRCQTPINGPVRVLLYMGHRRSEVTEATWDEFDLDAGTWLVPRERAKNRVSHLLGMPPPMVELFRRQYGVSGKQALVWPAPRSGRGLTPEKPINAFTKPMIKLTDEMQKIARGEGKVVEPWTLHDLRRTLVTGMHSIIDVNSVPIIPYDVIERVVNHKIVGVRGIYNRHAYFAQKRTALKIWSDHLEEIRTRYGLP